MRKLSLAFIATAALLGTALIGPPAAGADDLTGEKYPTLITGSTEPFGEPVFTTTAGNVKIKKATYTGTIGSATTTGSITPFYGEITGFGFPITPDLNGCVYRFNIGAATTGDMDILCPAGQEMTFTAESAGILKCTVHIPAQSDITGSVVYSNVGTGPTREVRIEASLTGIDYTHTAGTGIGACASGSATTGTLTFKAILTGEEDLGPNHIGLFLS